MSTARRVPPSPAAPSNRKLRKADERARQRTAERGARLRRVGLPALLLLLAVSGIVAFLLRPTPEAADPALRLDTPNSGGGGVAWSPDGTAIAVGGTGTDRAVHVVNGTTGAAEHTLPARGRIADLAWSPDGSLIAVASVQQPKVQAATRSQRARAPEPPSLVDLVELWRTSTWTRVATPPTMRALSNALAVAFSPDGRYLAIQNGQGLLTVALPTLRTVATAVNPIAIPAFRPVLSWSRDGRRIMVGRGGFDGQAVDLLDGTSLRLQRSLSLPGAYPQNLIAAASWAPDGTRVFVAGTGGLCATLSGTTGSEARVFPVTMNSIASAAWSPDGRRIAIGGIGAVVVYDALNGTTIARHEVTRDAAPAAALTTVTGLAWARDSRALAFGGSNSHARIWNVATR